MFVNDRARALKAASLTILFLMSVTASAAFAQNGEMPLSGSKEAVALFNQGRQKTENLENPGTLFDQAVQKDPNFALGHIYAGQNNRDTQKHLGIALQLIDKASPGEREWILAAKALNDGDGAGRRTHLENLLKLHPKDKRAHSLMGIYYRNNGDETSALRHFNEAISIDKKYAPAYNNIGYSNMALGKMGDAEAAFKSYIKLIPANPNPYDSYAELLMRNGKHSDSIAQYNMALAKDPSFLASYRGIGNNHEYMGDFANARLAYQKMFDKAANDGQRDQALVYMMNSYLAQGDSKKALEYNDKRLAVAEKDNDAATLYGLHSLAAFVSLEAGNLAGAAEHFGMADKLINDPSLTGNAENRRFNSRVGRARLMAAQGNFEEANKEVLIMQEFVSTRQNVNLRRGYEQTAGFVALHNKDYAKAAEHFAKTNPTDPYMWYYRALALEGAGDSSGAADLYRKIAGWNRLVVTGYAVVRPKAIAKLQSK